MKLHSLLSLSTFIFFSASAHELNLFGKIRPAISREADQELLRIRNVERAGTVKFEKEMRSLCPKQYAVIDQIFSKLKEHSPLNQFLVVPHAPTVIILCDSRNDKHANTGLAISGKLIISGSYIGKANSDDAIAFILAHELSHFLYAHDEEFIQNMLDHSEHNPAPTFHQDPTAEEKLADESALELMARAGYSLKGAKEAMGMAGVESGECVDILGLYFCPGSRSQTHVAWHGTAAQRIGRINSEISLHQYSKNHITKSDLLREAKSEWKSLIKRFN